MRLLNASRFTVFLKGKKFSTDDVHDLYFDVYVFIVSPVPGSNIGKATLMRAASILFSSKSSLYPLLWSFALLLLFRACSSREKNVPPQSLYIGLSDILFPFVEKLTELTELTKLTVFNC